ncbi:MAG: SDR family oxidoreductase [Gammaproteobacteria bacterium]|nr:SDR family oxidoreductase [Gammaproteobacteria bacterium]
MKTKSILITGCSTGIGRCVAEGLEARGYRVFATARKAEDVEALQEKGLESLRLDLDDSDSIHAAVDEVLARTGGRIYALFNNAGYGQPGAVEDLRREVLRAQFETNLFGVLELTNRIIPIMRAQGQGRIIQNSSLLGLAAMPYRGAYNASKFALEGLTDTLRLELAGSGIHVSLIEPGPIKSRFRANAHAAYKRNIDPEHSAHRERYANLERRLAKQGPAAPFTLPPEAVLKKVIHALESPRPKIRYYVTVPTHFIGTIRRALPYRALDRVLAWISGEGKR